MAAAFLGGWPPICGGSLVWSSWSYVFLEVVVSFLVFLGVLWWFFLLLVGFLSGCLLCRGLVVWQ